MRPTSIFAWCLYAAAGAVASGQIQQVPLAGGGGYAGGITLQPGTLRLNEDPVQQARTIDDVIRQLQEAPGVKEVFDLQKKIDGISTQADRDKRRE